MTLVLVASTNTAACLNTTRGNTTSSALSYDARGLLWTQGRFRNNFDDANRLIQVKRLNATTGANEWASNFSYDGLNRKRRIVEYSWNASSGVWVQQSDRRTLYDGMTEIQERNGSNGVTASYTRGLDLGGGIGGLLARSVPGVGSFYYHYDGSGNVVQLTDAVTQATVARYDYDAFGNLLAWSGAQTVQPYRFSSKAQHSNSGLIDFGFRFYSPELGRFLNRDPIGEAGGINLYGFVGNSPPNAIDPHGLWSLSRLLYTGDPNASDEVYNAALDAGAGGLDCWKMCMARKNKKLVIVAGTVAAGAAPQVLPIIPKSAVPIELTRGLTGAAGQSTRTTFARVVSLTSKGATDPVNKFIGGQYGKLADLAKGRGLVPAARVAGVGVLYIESGLSISCAIECKRCR